ncbi:hypothetical protein [Silvimonas amylolytica]|uniref:NnrS family protein n=1 Tax=Silvimonas amylolytica TaxID=449663 RepID=A0ABQ2PKN7_9NEIS|nr:hypothetical protein [Silvimonas amylolytica]GGP26172.1 hypothetical protein GCM10010971_19910 [Silvimonas amylolytica]
MKRTALPLLLLAISALLAGMYGGLARLGFVLPVGNGALIIDHGSLMVCGFFGSLIALERAMALRSGWAMLAPALTAIGTLAAVFWPTPGMILMIAGAGLLTLASLQVYRIQPAPFNAFLVIAVLGLLAGDLVLWYSHAPWLAVPGWMVFLVLTIAGERLELTRLMPKAQQAARRAWLPLSMLVTGAILAVFWYATILGLGLLNVALWLMREDIARRNLRQHGLTRYIAACLLSGYAWLALAGALLAWHGAQPFVPGMPHYDAVLHMVFIGFVVGMVFGHAPIIIPALTGCRLRYRPMFYAPLALLQITLLLRVVGDLAHWPAVRQAGGMLNVATLLFFAVLILTSITRRAPVAPRAAPSANARPASPHAGP